MPAKKSHETAAGSDGIYYQFLTHLPQDCLKNSTQIIQHHLALWGSPFFVEGGHCGANPKTKQRPFRPNQPPTDSPHKLSLQDHGTNGQ